MSEIESMGQSSDSDIEGDEEDESKIILKFFNHDASKVANIVSTVKCQLCGFGFSYGPGMKTSNLIRHQKRKKPDHSKYLEDYKKMKVDEKENKSLRTPISKKRQLYEGSPLASNKQASILNSIRIVEVVSIDIDMCLN